MKKIVLITGASRGLGREVALLFGRAGWRVGVNYLGSAEKAREVVREIGASGGEAVALRADVRLRPDVEAMVAELVSRWGRVDVLVNNAGVGKGALVAKLDDALWDHVLDTNLKGCFNCIRAVSETMAARGSGHVVNVSSILGQKGKTGHAAYAASKSALIGLTKSAAAELAPHGIQVNAVIPGYMLTDMGAGASEKAREEALSESLLKRFAEPGEVAEFILHLVGMRAVSGQVFNLDSRVA